MHKLWFVETWFYFVSESTPRATGIGLFLRASISRMGPCYDSNEHHWESVLHNGTFSHNMNDPYYYPQYDDVDEQHILWRFLKDDQKDVVRVDYSVLSVGVMTLGLILVVEVLRHKIDHAALRRPFFKAVLEGVYSERTLRKRQSSAHGMNESCQSDNISH